MDNQLPLQLEKLENKKQHQDLCFCLGSFSVHEILAVVMSFRQREEFGSIYFNYRVKHYFSISKSSISKFKSLPASG